jgi:hypothetical protein
MDPRLPPAPSASAAAASRLQVLAQQLAAAPTSAAEAHHQQQDDSVRPAPGGGKGTLTIVDNRTGKKYTVRRAGWMDEAPGRGARQTRTRQPPPFPRGFAAAAAAAASSPAQLTTAACASLSPPTPKPSSKKTQVEISDGGTIQASALKKITAGGDGVGLRCYDNGCVGLVLGSAAAARDPAANALPPPLTTRPPNNPPPHPYHHTNSYTNTTAVISRISYIDGDRGVLRYRGYPIEELVTGGASFLEVAYLVLYGDLPAR